MRFCSLQKTLQGAHTNLLLQLTPLLHQHSGQQCLPHHAALQADHRVVCWQGFQMSSLLFVAFSDHVINSMLALQVQVN